MKTAKKRMSRTNFLTGLLLVAFGLIVGRLFQLQIIDNQKYLALADAEQMRRFEIPARRGLIYAMDEKTPIKLVMNETIYTVFADPQIIKEADKNKMIEVLRQTIGGNLRDNFESLLDKKETRYQILATKVNRKQAELIKKEEFSGIGFQETSQRVYPEGKLAAQVLGFVNSEGGQYGIEGSLNKELSGTNGLLKTVTDVAGVPLTIGNRDIDTPAENGKNIVLSIDRNIQAQTEKILKNRLEKSGAKEGSVLVMDPQTGKIMAMANFPTYNPAEFFKVQDAAAFNNRTATAPYENGSVIKALTMAMGIDTGVADQNSTYYNTDSVKIDDITVKNAVLGHTGTITMQTAMNYSLNTGMVEIASRLGGGRITKEARDTMYDYYHNRFGLGQKTGLEIAESSGILISPDEVQGNAVRYSNMSFGQGMDLTMVQTATAFSAAINGGTLYKTSIINGEVDKYGNFAKKDPEIRKSNVVKSTTSDTLKQTLIDARRSVGMNSDLEGYQVGGKTGTSETVRDGRYVADETIASYLGFGGNNSPKFVIMVSVSGAGQNLQGSQDAGPIFTELSNWMLNYLKVQPKGN
ncbi:MAG: penicillin-binding protein 2 [Candidatus Sacchiramonaceae bacterium]|nr:penicillin-binding protein 2 [Candidatus Saccharimonadaceae bacterium]